MAARKQGREKRAGTTDDAGTGLVRVKLDDKTWAERSDELASEIKKLEAVEAKKALAAEKFNAEIKIHKERISVLADEVDTHEANVDAQVSINYEPIGGRREGAAAAEAANQTSRSAAIQ